MQSSRGSDASPDKQGEQDRQQVGEHLEDSQRPREPRKEAEEAELAKRDCQEKEQADALTAERLAMQQASVLKQGGSLSSGHALAADRFDM